MHGFLAQDQGRDSAPVAESSQRREDVAAQWHDDVADTVFLDDGTSEAIWANGLSIDDPG